MITSKEYYNEVAVKYSELQSGRLNYLLSVENNVSKFAGGKKIHNYLDIGCGDGIRSLRIIKSLNPERSVLLDESSEMINLARRFEDNSIKVIESNFIKYEFSEPFDMVTSLWNVFGHIESRILRLKFLEKIYSILNEEGMFIFDVNNRYNIRHYGLKNVIANLAKDIFTKAGSGNFNLKLDEKTSIVYIHHPFELDSLIRSAGFTRINKIYLDYNTGIKSRNFLSGQVIYFLEK